jgi:hypothetical protein
MEEKKKDNKELEMMEIAPEALDKIAGGMSERDQAKLMDLLAKNAIKDAAKKYGDSLTLQKAMDHGYEYLPRFVRPSSKVPTIVFRIPDVWAQMGYDKKFSAK